MIKRQVSYKDNKKLKNYKFFEKSIDIKAASSFKLINVEINDQNIDERGDYG